MFFMRQGMGQGSLYYLYIDIVFFINMAMDVVVLRLLTLILKVWMSTLRIILAGALRVLRSCILAVYPVFSPGLQLTLTFFLAGGLMVEVALHTKGVRELIRGMFGLYPVLVALGGTTTALYQHTRAGYYVEQLIRGEPTEGMPLAILVLLTASAVFAPKYSWITVSEARRQESNLYEVACTQGEKCLTTVGLLDIGNRLYEPVSRKYVYVMSERVWQKLYGREDPLLPIPFRIVGAGEGLMPGMILDSMVIKKEQGERVAVRSIIAASPHPVCQDGSYEILLHEEQDQKEELQAVIKVSTPNRFRSKSVPSSKTMLFQKQGEVHYIGGTDILPAPLCNEDEAKMIGLLGTEEEGEVKSILVEYNLRLVVRTAKKFDNTDVGVGDLISTGAIGLIKAINTFNPEKNTKLVIYAPGYIENEILMYLHRNNKTKMEMSVDEPLNVDRDGNGLLLSDILGTDEDIIYRNLEHETERSLLNPATDRLNPREKRIVELRFGLTSADGDETTQKEVVDLLEIPQSYISRPEKKIAKRLKKEIVRFE